MVKTVDQIADVREGEILVCTITSPAWAPIFSKIKAAVTDIGGVMSHAAIVCREYGLPAVVGTGRATSQIRTGQTDPRRRIDRRRHDSRRRRGRRRVSDAGAHSRPLAELRAADAAQFGGKSASLGELIAAGIPVPAGFALSTTGFGAFVEQAGLADGSPRRSRIFRRGPRQRQRRVERDRRGDEGGAGARVGARRAGAVATPS